MDVDNESGNKYTFKLCESTNPLFKYLWPLRHHSGKVHLFGLF